VQRVQREQPARSGLEEPQEPREQQAKRVPPEWREQRVLSEPREQQAKRVPPEWREQRVLLEPREQQAKRVPPEQPA
jgi:hypothetical protein